MFLIRLTYLKPLEVVEQFVTAHRHYLETAYQKNQLIVSGPMVPRTGGLILTQLNDRKAVEALIAEDPFHQEGIATFEILEFLPVKSHPLFQAFIK